MLFVAVPVIFFSVVSGIFLMYGKGSFLIAGYNTMSKKEKEKFDEKALCRFMGWFMFFMAFVMFFYVADHFFPGRRLSEYPPYLIFPACIFVLIYGNTGNRFSKKEKK